MTRTREENAADMAAEASAKETFKLVFTELKTIAVMIEVEVDAPDLMSAAEGAIEAYENGDYDVQLEEAHDRETVSCDTRVGCHDEEGVFVNLIN